MIFHAVGPEDASLVLLDAEVPHDFSDFFLDRVKSAVSGIQFDFQANSPVRAAIAAIDSDRRQFVDQSKVVARLFHEHHTRNTIKGALVIIVLRCDTGMIYALLKFDNDDVLSYVIQAQNGRTTANINILRETVTRSREALQKSAIVRLTDEGGSMALRDRSAPGDITHYFRMFLLVQRCYDQATLTKKIAQVARDTANANTDNLDVDVVRSIGRRIYDALQNLPGYEPESPAFVNAVFGAVAPDSPVVQDFHRRLQQAQIDEEEFRFDRDAVPRPQLRRIVTDEDVQIIFNRNRDDLVRVEDLPDGRKRISIDTRGLKKDDDYSETNQRRG